MTGKSGPKVKAPEIRDGLFEWVVDVRSALKGRLPKSIFKAKAKQLQDDWIQDNPDLPEEYEGVS